MDKIVEQVMKLDVSEEDTLVVTVPIGMTVDECLGMQRDLEEKFDGKKVRVVVVPHGTKVEVIPAFQNKEEK